MTVATLAGPLIISRLGDMASSFLFLSFVGHFLPKSLSQASFAWAFISFSTVVGIGLFSTLMIDAAGLKGNAKEQASILLATGLRVALTVAFSIFGGILVFSMMWHGLAGLLTPMNLGLLIMSLSLPAIYCQIVAFSYLNAIGRPGYEVKFVWLSNAIFMLVGLGYVYANLSVSFSLFVFIYILMRWIMVFLLLVYVSSAARRGSKRSILFYFRKAKVIPFMVKGAPLALCFAGESFLYFALSLISSGLGSLGLSAYQASLHFLSLIYMISIGVGNAVAIRVAGVAPGRNSLAAKENLLEGLKFGGCLMIPCLIVCFFLSGYVARLYTSDLAVAELIGHNIKISVPFLIFEFVYVVLRMTLRSLGDSWAPTIATMVCLNGVGLFLTWLLIYFYEASVKSVFIALNFCVFILMLYLIYRFLKIYRENTRLK